MGKASSTHRITEFLGVLPALSMIRAWKRASGPIFGEKALFHGIETRKGIPTLVISIQDPTWRQELSYQKQTLLDLFRLELKNEGFPDSKLPEDISLDAKKSLPLKSRNAQP